MEEALREQLMEAQRRIGLNQIAIRILIIQFGIPGGLAKAVPYMSETAEITALILQTCEEEDICPICLVHHDDDEEEDAARSFETGEAHDPKVAEIIARLLHRS